MRWMFRAKFLPHILAEKWSLVLDEVTQRGACRTSTMQRLRLRAFKHQGRSIGVQRGAPIIWEVWGQT